MVGYKALTTAFLIIGGSKIFPIKKKVVKIGRAFENDLVLEYPQISRNHAELRYLQGHFEIIDLDSTGGTYVNGAKIDNKILDKGDVISLVNLHLVFGQDEMPDPDQTTQYRKPQAARQGDQDTMKLPPNDSHS